MRTFLLALVVLVSSRPGPAQAAPPGDDLVIYVARKRTGAHAAAKAKGSQAGAAAATSLHAALALAARHLNQPGARKVRLEIAAGSYRGKVGLGIWEVPHIDNPRSVLRILGGYDDAFVKRDPFRTPTRLETAADRSAPILTLAKKSRLREIVISGLHLDAAPSNRYDPSSDSLERARSRTLPMLGFTNVITEHLVVADCTFLNGSHGAFDPFIAPLSAETVVEITNNLFFNNVKTIKVGAGLDYRGNRVKEIRLHQNSFLLNWPYDPDVKASNVAAVELNNSSSAQRLDIRRNLFAYNVGGALQHDWPEKRMPAIVLRNNLFYKNALLFGKKQKDAGVFVGKFGPAGTYRVLDLDTIEESFAYEVKGNLALKPGLSLSPQLAVREEGDDVHVEGYAPAVKLDPEALPLPRKRAARGFGVQPDAVWTATGSERERGGKR